MPYNQKRYLSTGGAFNKVAAAVAYAKQVGYKLEEKAFIIDEHIADLTKQQKKAQQELKINGHHPDTVATANSETAANVIKSASGPWHLIEKDLERMNQNIRVLLAAPHPVLETIANYYFNLKVRLYNEMLGVELD